MPYPLGHEAIEQPPPDKRKHFITVLEDATTQAFVERRSALGRRLVVCLLPNPKEKTNVGRSLSPT